MPSDELILWDEKNEKKGSHRKFESLWKGPFKVLELIGTNIVKLSYRDGEILPYTYNGLDLKLFKFLGSFLYIVSLGSYFILVFIFFCSSFLFLAFGIPTEFLSSPFFK